jgi:hypothetical protein
MRPSGSINTPNFVEILFYELTLIVNAERVGPRRMPAAAHKPST